MKKISLFNRKRLRDLNNGKPDVTDEKKSSLLAMKLDQLYDHATASGDLKCLPLDQIEPDPRQPRKRFPNLDSLCASIKAKGVLQPIIVTPSKASQGKFTIIAGERRYRASKMAELKTLPVIVRNETDTDIVLLQLLENNQRENVSPLEESDALAMLVEQLGANKSQIAKGLGQDVAWVSIRLGLQGASDEIKALVREGVIEDVRTLHELRMYEKEQPKAAATLIDRIRNNQLSGSYRQAIAGLRRKKKAKNALTNIKKVRKMERVGNQILLDVVGSQRPLTFEVPAEVLVQFIANSTASLQTQEVKS